MPLTPEHTNAPVLHKVSALITRKNGSTQDLLVFRHPTAGIQVPAGTVEAGESLEDAVFREIQEEAGITQVRLLKKLATLEQPLKTNQRVLLQSTRLMSEPEGGLLEFSLTRGTIVRMRHQQKQATEIAYEEYDFNLPDPVAIERFKGWIPSFILTSYIQRHLFHLCTTVPLPEEWSVRADRGLDFHFYWMPLQERIHLVHSQDHWLDYLYNELK